MEWNAVLHSLMCRSICLQAYVPWLRHLVIDLSLQSPKFNPRPVHVEFVVSIVPLEQVYL